MTRQVVTTTPHNSGLGDPAFTAFEKLNANDAELYAAAGVTGASALSAATYAIARTLTGTTTGDRLQVLGRTTQSDGGQGLFTWVAGGSTTLNDGIELTATGGIWRRAGIFLLDPAMLGLASFTFATLPTAGQMVNMPAGIEALTTDQGLEVWSGTAWAAVAATIPTIVNLRQLGVTAVTSAAFNTDAILAAITQAGPGGTLVIPNWGNNQPTNHLGFTIPGGFASNSFTITGENPRSFNPATSGAWLQCVDNTALGIGLAAGATGLTVSNLTIGGGFFGLRTGPAGSTTTGFGFYNLHFFGPFGRAALAFAGHNEHGRIENIYIDSVGAGSYGIEWLNEAQGSAALADIRFDYIWVYGACKVPVFLVNENPQESIQGVEFGNYRATQQNYCSVAVRAPCQGLVFHGIGAEAGNTTPPSGSKADMFVDTSQYGGPASMNATLVKVIGTNSALGAPDFPIFNRGASLTLDLTPDILPVGNVANSFGITSIIDPNIVGNGGAAAIGVDPSAAVDSHKTTYLGNLGSNQPIFDYWPRGPMLDDTLLYQNFDSADDDDYQFLNAA